jgi:hypothetical protein
MWHHVRLWYQVEWLNLVYTFFVIVCCLVYMFVVYRCHDCCHGIILHLFFSAAFYFRFYHFLPGTLSHSTILIDCHHFCVINRSIDVLIFASYCLYLCPLSFFCQVVAIVLAFQSIVVFILVVSCLLHHLSSTCSIGWVLWLGLIPSLVLNRSAQSIMIDHCCHWQIAANVFPQNQYNGWY